MEVLLQLMGHEVRVADGGHEAIPVAADFSPYVALLDLQMPKVDGYEAARRLREQSPQIRLVATTGLARENDIAARRRSGLSFESRRAGRLLACGCKHLRSCDVRRLSSVARTTALSQRLVVVGDGSHKQHHTKEESEVVHRKRKRQQRELLSRVVASLLLTHGKWTQTT